jgi:hypothetical protein
MTDEKNPLTPKEGCEECKNLHSRVASAREAKNYLIHGYGTGYRREKSRSRQYKQVQEQMNENENAERLARANLRVHEMLAHEGVTESNGREYAEYVTIKMRSGRTGP